jgi:Glycosyl transferase family 2
VKIVAILAVRNEHIYLTNTLRNLIEDGIYFALLDNNSTDQTREIVLRDEFRSHLVAFKDIAFDGTFDLARQLSEKMALMQSIEADWFLHHDADESYAGNWVTE